MKKIPLILLCTLNTLATAAWAGETRALPRDWMLGPFTRPENAEPVIKPNPASTFDCPMRKRPVKWEALHTFNPAAVVKDGKIYVLYRAEDNEGNAYMSYTSRLGLAWSEDGIHFTRHPKPVLYPADDDQKPHEWEGGCEDPRLVELEDGSYAVFYTQYHRIPSEQGWKVTVGIARSKDLFTWEKQGHIIATLPSGEKLVPRKSTSLVCRVKDGRLIATKINGRYWLYQGEHTVSVLSSENLRDWDAVPGDVLVPRPGRFDSDFPECGPPAVLTEHGIVLLYNGKNAAGDTRDKSLAPETYAAGQALFDAKEPSRLLAIADEPFLRPELPWEQSGQYVAGTTFIEGLVLFKNRWFLYYGSADNFVGVASAPAKPAR